MWLVDVQSFLNKRNSLTLHLLLSHSFTSFAQRNGHSNKHHVSHIIIMGTLEWASYQIRKIAGCACAGNAGNVFPRRRFQRKPLVSDPGMHHGTCVTHVPWCMSGSLTCGDGENVPGIPGACAPANLRIWQEAHCEMTNCHYDMISYIYTYTKNNENRMSTSCQFLCLKSTTFDKDWFHYNDVIIGAMASQFTSLRLFTQPFINAQIKKKISKLRVTGLCVRGIHRWPMNSTHKGPVAPRMFPFDDVIMQSI